MGSAVLKCGGVRAVFTKRSDPDKICFILWDLPWMGRPTGRWDGGSCRITLGFVLEEGAGVTSTQNSPARRGRSRGKADIALHFDFPLVPGELKA